MTGMIWTTPEPRAIKTGDALPCSWPDDGEVVLVAVVDGDPVVATAWYEQGGSKTELEFLVHGVSRVPGVTHWTTITPPREES